MRSMCGHIAEIVRYSLIALPPPCFYSPRNHSLLSIDGGGPPQLLGFNGLGVVWFSTIIGGELHLNDVGVLNFTSQNKASGDDFRNTIAESF